MENLYLTIGPPGCGKTTALVKAASEAANRFGANAVMITSLTRAAAAEVSSREMPIPTGRVKTLHGHAFAALGCPSLAVGKMLAEWNKDEPIYAIGHGNPSSVDDFDSIDTRNTDSLGEKLQAKYDLFRARKADRQAWPHEVRKFAEKWEAWKSNAGLLDFGDLIEQCTKDVEQAPGNPAVIYADEVQDYSRAELDLLLHWGKQANGVILVGDIDQTIYAWRGADPGAFMDLEIPAKHHRVLSQSYRVPRSVQVYAAGWIDRVKAREKVEYNPRAFDGEVRSISCHYKFAEGILNDAESYLKAGKTVMFLGTCGFHVAPLVAVLRKQGIPFHNPYRTKRGDWNPLGPRRGVSASDRIASFLKPLTNGKLWTTGELAAWAELCSADKLLSKGAKRVLAKYDPDDPTTNRMIDGIDQLYQYFATHEVALDAVEAGMRGDLDWLKQRILPSKSKGIEYPLKVASTKGIEALAEEPKIIVGTIHSVKGGEADVVYVMPDMSPSGYEEWCRAGLPRDSVFRLFYVAMTRAKESLVICSPAGPLSVPLPPPRRLVGVA